MITNIKNILFSWPIIIAITIFLILSSVSFFYILLIFLTLFMGRMTPKRDVDTIQQGNIKDLKILAWIEIVFGLIGTILGSISLLSVVAYIIGLDRSGSEGMHIALGAIMLLPCVLILFAGKGILQSRKYGFVLNQVAIPILIGAASFIFGRHHLDMLYYYFMRYETNQFLLTLSNLVIHIIITVFLIYFFVTTFNYSKFKKQ